MRNEGLFAKTGKEHNTFQSLTFQLIRTPYRNFVKTLRGEGGGADPSLPPVNDTDETRLWPRNASFARLDGVTREKG